MCIYTGCVRTKNNSRLIYKTAASPLIALIPSIHRYLKRGGVIAYATESCFGLGCDPLNYRAVKLILSIKNRPQKKGLILVAADLAFLAPYIAPLTQPELNQLNQIWPGPTTVLLPASPSIPHWITGNNKTVAARVSAHTDTARLSHALHMAIVSTSANRSGKVPCKRFQHCIRAFGNKVMVLPGRIGKRKRPSTIMDLKSGKIFRD